MNSGIYKITSFVISVKRLCKNREQVLVVYTVYNVFESTEYVTAGSLQPMCRVLLVIPFFI